MTANDWITTVSAFLAVILPAVVKLFHALGRELPWLTALSDWVADRPKVAVRRAKR